VKTLNLVFLGATLFAFLMAGCGSPGSGGQGSDNSTVSEANTESDFTSDLDQMQSTIDWYSAAPDPAADIGDFHSRMTGDLGRLDDLMTGMENRCVEFDPCPEGGGMTGDISGQCMRGGHMMDQGRMVMMFDLIDTCRTAMEDFFGTCGTQWDDTTCRTMMNDDLQRMKDAMGSMRSDSNTWWSGQAGYGHCGMMDGGGMGG
jgi:hypothetical protein